jgi:hypothetical protein
MPLIDEVNVLKEKIKILEGNWYGIDDYRWDNFFRRYWINF